MRRLPFDIDELRTGVMPPPPTDSLSTWAGRFQLLDRALHWYERHPLRGCGAPRCARAAEWILRRQEHDGGWGGIQPPWVYSIMALHLLGYPLDHPALAQGARRVSTASRSIRTGGAGSRRVSRRCGTPRWRWSALNDAGVADDQPDAGRARSTGSCARRSACPATGPCAGRKLEPGGWAFEFANDNYPDIDDTAEVVLALRGASAPGRAPTSTRRSARGVAWTLGMQSLERRLGRVRRRQHEPALRASSRSATSAR